MKNYVTCEKRVCFPAGFICSLFACSDFWPFNKHHTVDWRYEYYFLVLKTVFYSLVALVKYCFLRLIFICARLELFCDFKQSDFLHERAAFYDILARVPIKRVILATTFLFTKGYLNFLNNLITM